METCRCLLDEFLPVIKRTDREYDDTSFTGLPPELLDAARQLAHRRKVYPRDVFQDAITELLFRLNAGERADWPQSRPKIGQNPYHTRLETEVLGAMRGACDKLRVKKNIFFLAALRDYLRRNGFEVEI